MELTIAIDFGSTFTKVTFLNLEKEVLVTTAKDASTVDTDIMIRLK